LGINKLNATKKAISARKTIYLMLSLEESAIVSTQRSIYRIVESWSHGERNLIILQFCNLGMIE